MLWAYRTTSRRSMGETPFSMTYTIEVVILVEIGLLNMRIVSFFLSENETTMTEQLYLLEENK